MSVSVLTSRWIISVFLHVPACAVASESSGNDFEGILQDNKGCNSQIGTVWTKVISMGRTDGPGEDSETDSVTDSKSDSD